MATSGKAFGISLAIYSAICIIVFLLFSWWRSRDLTKKFYAPKRYVRASGHKRPPRLRNRLGAWAGQVCKMSEAEVIQTGGVDAAMYVKFLRMGMEIFLLVGLLVSVMILPINVTGTEVDRLMSVGTVEASQFTYWLNSPPPPPGTDTSPSSSQTGAETIAAPEFYNTSIPDAPPGLTWWEYLPDVPPLADPVTLLGPAYARYGWRYDSSFQTVSYKFTGLDKTTMANIPDRSPRLWAHAVAVYLVTLLLFYELWKYSAEALRLRTYYLLNLPPGAEAQTVLVTDIPGVLCGTIPQRLSGTLLKFVPAGIKEKAFKHVSDMKHAMENKAVRTMSQLRLKKKGTDPATAAASNKLSSFATEIDPATGKWSMPDPWQMAADQLQTGDSIKEIVQDEFLSMYHGAFRVAHMVYDTSDLDPLVAEYEKRQTTLEDLLDDYIAKLRRGKKIKPAKTTVLGPSMGAWGRDKYGLKPQKIDSLEFLHDRMEQLKIEIEEEQEKAKEKVFPSAFVTFNSRVAQVTASRSLMNEDLSAWRVEQAPAPGEILWQNIGWRIWERAARGVLMIGAFFCLCMFFMIPVAAVQGLLTTNSLVSGLQNVAILNSLVTAILPGLALKIFLMFVPSIITAMNKFSGMVSLSQVDLALTSRYFIFQVITVFFGSFIAGSFFNQFKQFIDDPGSIVTVLGTSAPQTAIFFMSYVLVQALLTQPLNIIRIVPLVIFWVKSKLAATARAKRRLWENQEFSFGTVIPNDTITILLGVAFCCICPLITPVAFLYFASAYLVNKYMLVYVYKQPYQTGAVFWKNVFDQIIVGIFIFQLLMIGLLGIKKVIGPPIFLIPSLFLTFAFYIAAHARYWRPFEGMSLLSAAMADERERQGLESGELVADDDKEVEERYLSPSFKFNVEHHDKLMSDATRMQSVLSGSKDDDLLGLDDSDDEKGSLASTAVDIEAPEDASPTNKGPAAPEAPAPEVRAEEAKPEPATDEGKASA